MERTIDNHSAAIHERNLLTRAKYIVANEWYQKNEASQNWAIVASHKANLIAELFDEPFEDVWSDIMNYRNYMKEGIRT